MARRYRFIVNLGHVSGGLQFTGIWADIFGIAMLIFFGVLVWSAIKAIMRSAIPLGSPDALSADNVIAKLTGSGLPPPLVETAIQSGTDVLGSRDQAAQALYGVLETGRLIQMARQRGAWMLVESHLSQPLYQRWSAQGAFDSRFQLISVGWRAVGVQQVATVRYSLAQASTTYEDWTFVRNLSGSGPSVCPHCGALDGVENGVCRYCKAAVGALPPTAGSAELGGWVVIDVQPVASAAA